MEMHKFIITLDTADYILQEIFRHEQNAHEESCYTEGMLFGEYARQGIYVAENCHE